MDSKKLESNLVNMVTVLTAIAIISSLSLGFTYIKTKDAIEAVQLKKKIEAIKAVTPEFDSNPDASKFTVQGAEGLEFYPVSKGGENVGVAIKTFSSKGFSGNVSIMVGLDKQGNIYNTAVLQHAETPGLGSKMDTDKFKKQFMGKNPTQFKLSVKKDGGDVDAITAATISSRAFCDAVQKACTTYQKKKPSAQAGKS